MDFADLTGRYLQARMDQATRPFTDPETYMNDRFRNQFNVDLYGNARPVSTTITYNEDGTQTVTEKKDVTPGPAPIPVARTMPMVQTAPAAPTAPATPVNPADVYQRMIQAESGGRNFDAQGRPLTSPAGAMYAAQVMPSTAANPGYGVRPAQAQTPEEYNRVGQDYYNAMLNKFGNPMTAAAAYNAGPGRVNQNLQANQGQLNVSQLPQETQQYLQRVGFQPGAAQPVAAPAPQPQPQPQVQPVQMTTNGQPPAMTPPPPTDAVSTGQYIDITGNVSTEADYNTFYGKQVINNLNNPVELSKIIEDPNAPEFAKIAASRQAFELLKVKKDQADAQRKVDEGDTTAIANALKKRTEEGSYIKAYLFQRLGLTELASSEQAKLGAGRVWEQNTLENGQAALIQRDSNGLPLYGISEKGRELSPQELVRFGGAAIKGVEQGATVYKDPFFRAEVRDAQGNVIQPAQGVAGNWILERRPGRAPVFREAGTNRIASPEEARRLNPTGVSGPIEQQYAAAYASRGGGKQGEQGAEGYVQGQLPGAPGIAAPGAAQPAPGAAQPAPGVPTTPVSTGAPPQPVSAIPSANPVLPVYEQKKAANIAEKRTEAFNKIIDTEYRDNGAKGEIVSNNRKLQFDILNRDDPATGKKVAELISGLQTAANEDPSNQKWSIVRDLFAGKVATNPDGTPMNGQQLSDRMTQLNLSPTVKSALTEYNALNAQIAGQTLRETAGPGSVSDAEQQANRARNVEITKTPMLGVYNMMAQSQFNADLQRYKADLAAGPGNTAANATAFDRDFRRYQAELVKSYREVTEARLKFIQENGGGPGAIREGYKRYPVPEYDAQTGNWKYLKPLDQIIKKKEGTSL